MVVARSVRLAADPTAAVHLAVYHWAVDRKGLVAGRSARERNVVCELVHQRSYSNTYH